MGGDDFRMVNKVQKGIIFPGQGAQFVGMGQEIYDQSSKAREIFDIADSVLKISLSKYCFEGPLEELTKTDISQPAIFTMSYAVYASIQEKYPEFEPIVLGGLSLGEWTALVAAGCIDFIEALKLVYLRGYYMQKACNDYEGAMASVLGLELNQVKDILSNETEVQIANINSPKQIVISGLKPAVAFVSQKLKDCGAKRVIPLSVAGAFHSQYMQKARENLSKDLNAINFKNPKIPVTSNFTGHFYQNSSEIKQNLLNQITGSVQWVQNMELMSQHAINGFFEIGPNKVLKGLAKAINPDILVNSISNFTEIEQISSEILQNKG